MPEDPSPLDKAPTKSTTTKSRASAKPRAGIQRKSKAEREEYARKEAERTKERENQDVTQTVRPVTTRGRGPTRVGRGAAVVNRIERTLGSANDGVFGASIGQRLERGRGTVDLGVSEAMDGDEPTIAKSALDVASTSVIDLEGSSGVKRSGTTRTAHKQHVSDNIIQIEDDDDMDGTPRRDIERIWISSGDDDETMANRKDKQRRRSRSNKLFAGLRPVRAARTVTSERVDNRNDADTKPPGNENQPLRIDPEHIPVAEPQPSSKKDPLSSPELTRRPPKKTENKTKDTRLLTETVEEKAERLRLQDDIVNLREAFIHKSDTDDSVGSKEEEPAFGRSEHQRMFLFQLPPLVPQLHDPLFVLPHEGDKMDTDQIQVKVEDAAAAAAIAAAQKTDDQAKVTSKTVTQIYTADMELEKRLPAGFVGKLRIHKSGKISLDWGGSDMEVRYGAEVDFLQDVVCVEAPDSLDAPKSNGEDTAQEMPGKAYALGHVKKKMVLVPDWGKLYA